MNIAKISTVSLLGLFTLSLASLAGAQTYIGEACWETQSEGEPETDEDFVVLAFFDIGDFHLTVNGYSFSTDDVSIDERTLLNGSAEFFGNTIMMSLNGTLSDDNEAAAIAVHVKLSAATLGGTFEVMGTGIDKNSEESGLFVDNGTLTFVGLCP